MYIWDLLHAQAQPINPIRPEGVWYKAYYGNASASILALFPCIYIAVVLSHGPNLACYPVLGVT